MLCRLVLSSAKPNAWCTDDAGAFAHARHRNTQTRLRDFIQPTVCANANGVCDAAKSHRMSPQASTVACSPVSASGSALAAIAECLNCRALRAAPLPRHRSPASPQTGFKFWRSTSAPTVKKSLVANFRCAGGQDALVEKELRVTLPTQLLQAPSTSCSNAALLRIAVRWHWRRCSAPW